MKINQIRGPFSYQGNKYKIYNKYLREKIDQFDWVIELFSGSAPILYNSKKGGLGLDIDFHVIKLHNFLKNKDAIQILKDLHSFYFSGADLKQNYLNLRSDFNSIYIKEGITDSIVPHLHILIAYSFNSLLRFGPNGYNVPLGFKIIDFDKLELHSNLLKEKEISFINSSYTQFNPLDWNKETTIIYIDPPYLASKYKYGGWSKEDELALLDWIDVLDKKGYKFILSNTFYHRGLENSDLILWSKKYLVQYLNINYHSWSSSVEGVNKELNTVEVIISN